MITVKEFMETVDYRVTEGSEFCWKCFGEYAYRLESWNGEQDGYSVSIVFDTQTQVVYQAEAYDYAHNRAYRWQNPEHLADHEKEATTRNVDAKEAYEGVNFIDLEVKEDFLDKARAIVQGREYDTRVQVEIDLDNDLMFAAMKEAHSLDITFNQLVEKILSAKVEELTGNEGCNKEDQNV